MDACSRLSPGKFPLITFLLLLNSLCGWEQIGAVIVGRQQNADKTQGAVGVRFLDVGVADGARTHDNRNHNPGLYQLSYSHRRGEIIAGWFAMLHQGFVITNFPITPREPMWA